MRCRSFVWIFLVFLTACTGKPGYVLSDRKMENVLFDLYIAETEINENSTVFYNDSAKKRDLLESVFRKHRVSQEKFDTSLVWYNAHIKQYMKINTRLTDRYDRLIAPLEADAERRKRWSQRRLSFKELNLKDFFTPLSFPWLPENKIDSIPADLPAEQEIRVDSIQSEVVAEAITHNPVRMDSVERTFSVEQILRLDTVLKPKREIHLQRGIRKYEGGVK
jgi:hypothetical protein